MAVSVPTRRARAPRRGAAACILAALLAGCGGGDTFEEPVDFTPPATTVNYDAEVEGAPSEEIADLMRESLLVFRRREDGAQSLAFLRRRAEGDIATAERILRSFGYYQPEVTMRVEEVGDEEGDAEPVDAEALEDDGAAPRAEDGGSFLPDTVLGIPLGAAVEDALAETDALVTVVIEPGPAFTLERHDFAISGFEPGPPPALGPASAYGSPVGAQAEAAPILDAENRAVAAIREQGFFYADTTGRDAVADLEADTLAVETAIATGRAYRFGPTTISGAPNVEEDYLRTYIPWEEGEVVEAGQLSRYQRRLLSTGLFRSGFVTLPEDPPEGETAPVAVELEEAPFRTFSAGVRFSSDDGPSTRLVFEHRNLFGANENLRVTLDAGIDEQRLTNEFRKPQFLRPGQDLVGTLEFRRVEEDAFDEVGATFQLGVTRVLTERWTVGAGGLLEVSRINDAGEDGTAYLVGIPLSARYDSTADLLNPVDGERWRVEVIPFAGAFDGEAVTFARIDTTASVYRPLDDDADFVVAARGRLASIPSAELEDVPPTRRAFSGGAGSVRGYEEDFIGPLDDNEDPLGGRSVLEAGLELRYPIFGDLGGVAFIEGGSVSEDVVPTFDEGLQYAAGAGVRYYSPVGPLRVDFAFPINGREVDDSFQFYISIGQAY